MKPTLVVLAVGAALLASACTLTDKIVDGVNLYCGKPQAERQAYRALVNSQLSANGHSVAVTCKGD